jgi:hypothetical protein
MKIAASTYIPGVPCHSTAANCRNQVESQPAVPGGVPNRYSGKKSVATGPCGGTMWPPGCQNGNSGWIADERADMAISTRMTRSGPRPHKRGAATTPFRGLIVSAPLETSPPTERSRPARSNGNPECFQSRTCSAVPARRFRRCAGTLARVRDPGTVEAQRGSRASSGEAGGTKWLTK